VDKLCFTVRQKPSFGIHRLGGKGDDLTVLRDETFARQMCKSWRINTQISYLHVCTMHQQYQSTFLLIQLMLTIIKSQEC